MAKGKYTAKAAIRRIEAADAHIDKLSDQVVEAKLRARQHEAAARELPAVREELARVRRLAESGSSDTLEYELARFKDALEKEQENTRRIADILNAVLDRQECGLTEEEWVTLRRCIGDSNFFNGFDRITRRAWSKQSPSWVKSRFTDGPIEPHYHQI